MKCSDRLNGILATDYSADQTAITVTYGKAGYIRKTLLPDDTADGETAPLTEELIFRVVLMRGLLRYVPSVVFAVLTQAILFALIHIRPASGAASVEQLNRILYGVLSMGVAHIFLSLFITPLKPYTLTLKGVISMQSVSIERPAGTSDAKLTLNASGPLGFDRFFLHDLIHSLFTVHKSGSAF